MDESVAIDAKRILLRYGAPIAELARAIARTPLAEREKELRRLLDEGGFTAE